jgi:hypothetical protein
MLSKSQTECVFRYPDKIANAKWEVKELGIEHNGYVYA